MATPALPVGARRWAATASSASTAAQTAWCCPAPASAAARSVYANTLYEPPDAFYDDPQWRDITDWRAELAPYYDQAKRMLGVTTYNRDDTRRPGDAPVAERMGVGDTFHLTPVGVFFGAGAGRCPTRTSAAPAATAAAAWTAAPA